MPLCWQGSAATGWRESRMPQTRGRTRSLSSRKNSQHPSWMDRFQGRPRNSWRQKPSEQPLQTLEGLLASWKFRGEQLSTGSCQLHVRARASLGALGQHAPNKRTKQRFAAIKLCLANLLSLGRISNSVDQRMHLDTA